MSIRFDANVTDGEIDGQTLQDGIGRAMHSVRGKNDWQTERNQRNTVLSLLLLWLQLRQGSDDERFRDASTTQ